MASKQKQWQSPPAMSIDPDKKGYTAIMDTSEGTIRIDLFAKDAPKTVNNFVFLAREGYYDGTVFHRIVKDFMIQGGDPTGRGTGGPGYKFDDELPVKRSYEPGIVAMANSGRNTQGSQFFIVNGPGGKGLDRQPNYTQFGKVGDGMDAVQRMSNLPVVANPEMGGEVSKPKEPPKINSVKIEEYDLR